MAKMGKKVLWFSRHQMTEDQLAALGEVSELRQVSATIAHANELAEDVAWADVVAIVAPIGLQAEFLRLAGDKPVIAAVSDRIILPGENGEEQKVVFRFNHWDRLLKIEVQKEVYNP